MIQRALVASMGLYCTVRRVQRDFIKPGICVYSVCISQCKSGNIVKKHSCDVIFLENIPDDIMHQTRLPQELISLLYFATFVLATLCSFICGGGGGWGKEIHYIMTVTFDFLIYCQEPLQVCSYNVAQSNFCVMVSISSIHCMHVSHKSKCQWIRHIEVLDSENH